MHRLSTIGQQQSIRQTPKRDDKNAAKERRTPNEHYPHDTIVGLCNRVLGFLLLVSRY